MQTINKKLLEEIVGLRRQVIELTKKETESRQQLEMLNRYESALASSLHVIVKFDAAYNLTSVNRAFLREWGCASPAEMLGISVFELWQEKEKLKEFFALYQQPNWVGELQAVRKNRQIFPVHVTVYFMRDDAGRLLYGLVVMYNNAGTRQLDEQLHYVKKMDAVGRLAGSIAHDFNNILMIVISFSDLVLSDLSEDHPSREELEEIKKAGERGAAITRRLLTIASRQSPQLKLIEPLQFINNLSFLLRSIAGEIIKLELPGATPGGFIKIDSRQIEQVIINLVMNARDAMPGGGVLAISLSTEKFEDEIIRKYPHLYPGMYLVINIRDTGCGMDEQVKANIFEPFFTTKSNSSSGLGLATAYGFVRQNNGLILFDTVSGKGTTFKVYLPWFDAPATPPGDSVSRTGRSMLSMCPVTIMVVEDHDTVRKMIRQSLHTCGYNILEAANAGEALAICRSSLQAIQLVITDILMPGKSGPELVEELLILHPAIKVLFISGYKGEHELTISLLQCEKNFLLKPFSAETLLNKVRELLG